MVRLTICPPPSKPLRQMVPYLTVHPERLVYLHNACLSLGHPQRAGAKPCTVVVIHRSSRADRCQETASTTTTKPPMPASAIKFPIFDIREDMASEIGAFINTRGLLEPIAELCTENRSMWIGWLIFQVRLHVVKCSAFCPDGPSRTSCSAPPSRTTQLVASTWPPVIPPTHPTPSFPWASALHGSGLRGHFDP